jgi:hypothetical protein
MSIKYEPSKLIRKIAPRAKVAKLVTSRLTLKKAALSFVSEFDFLDKGSIARVALKAIKSYKTRVKEDPDLRADLVDDPALLVQRVQNEVVTQIAGEIRDNYAGEFYIWLPSSAEEPDPEHQLNYGQKFQVGDGEQPGDRYGCQCGMEILVDGSTLEL